MALVPEVVYFTSGVIPFRIASTMSCYLTYRLTCIIKSNVNQTIYLFNMISIRQP